MGFFHLKSAQLADQEKTGEAIIRVSQTAFQTSDNSEWAKFEADTKGWLYNNGYRYDGTEDGRVPATIDIIPVYDTPTKMHVRVPWKGDLTGAVPPPDEQPYGGSFPAFLARYFMRRCR